MFARTSSITILAFPLLAAATVITRMVTPTTPASQCDTGNLQCCSSTEEISDIKAEIGPGHLGGFLPGTIPNWDSLTGLVGITCSPLTIGGGVSSSCAVHPVCCSDNSFNGLLAFDCTPVDVNL